MGDDNEVTGESFWVYYRYAADVPMPDRHPFRWDRVKVTLQKGSVMIPTAPLEVCERRDPLWQ
jgi:hypothetical protein